jgi:uncharacterized protein YecE (DUF72 family)
MPLFVGTSGWDYTEWKGGFYPEKLPQSRFLEHYAGSLSACEINTTFYRVQSKKTFQRWIVSTPEHFRFAAKAHRRLTHTKQIGSPRDEVFLREFIDSLEPFGNRLHCLLLQFPPYREQDVDGLERLLANIPTHLPCALEFRHDSWRSSEVEDLIANSGGTVCVSDTDGELPSELPAGRIAYVRLRADRYTAEQRDAWLDLLTREAGRRDVYAFAKHRDVVSDDPFTGAGFAKWLVEHSSGREARDMGSPSATT